MSNVSEKEQCLHLIDNLIKYHTEAGNVLVVGVLKNLRSRVRKLR